MCLQVVSTKEKIKNRKPQRPLWNDPLLMYPSHYATQYPTTRRNSINSGSDRERDARQTPSQLPEEASLSRPRKNKDWEKITAPQLEGVGY